MNRRVDWVISQLRVIGGAESYVRLSAPRLIERGWNLRVITLVSGGDLIGELEKYQVPVVQLGARSVFDWTMISKLQKLLRQDPPEIVHTHLYHAGISGRVVARMNGIKSVIVHQHGPENQRTMFRSLLDRFTSRWVSCYIASCNAVSEILNSREKIGIEKIHVVYNGVAIPMPEKPAKPSDWPVTPEKLGIVCVGRLSPEKGQLELLDALAILKNDEQYFHLVYLGDGPMKDSIAKRAQELGLVEKISFAGFRREIGEWLPNFDIFILPSKWEGVSMALLEAMACGLPVVAIAVGGTPEIVVHGSTGFLVSPQDPKEMARAILTLIRDPHLRLRMGMAGYQRIHTQFTIEQNIMQLENIYQSLLG